MLPQAHGHFLGGAFPSLLVAALLLAEGALPSSSFAVATGTRASSVLLGILSFFKPTSNSWYWSLVSLAANLWAGLLDLEPSGFIHSQPLRQALLSLLAENPDINLGNILGWCGPI